MFNKLLALSVTGLLLYSEAAFAADAADMLNRITQQIPAFEKLVTGACYILGIGLVFKAMYHLKVYGEARTMMSVQSSLSTPLTYLFVGAALIFSPTFIASSLQTVFGSDSLLAYSQWGGYSAYGGTMMNAIFRCVQFVGLIAFFRGWVLMTHATGGQSQPGVFGKALTHILGGILALNIVATANILQETLGVSFT